MADGYDIIESLIELTKSGALQWQPTMQDPPPTGRLTAAKVYKSTSTKTNLSACGARLRPFH